MISRKEFVKFIKFSAVGGSGMIIDVAVTWIFKEKIEFNPYLSHLLGFVSAAFNNYLLNKYWTFQENEKVSIRQFSFFFLMAIIGLIISTIIIYLLHNFLGLDFYYSKIISIGIVSIWNYLINRYWVFSDHIKKVQINN